MFSLVGHRLQTIQKVKLGWDADGKLVAISHDVIAETSTFDEFLEPSAVQTRMVYDCPNVSTTHELVRVDAPTPTFMRAPGESTSTFALESAMDELAYAAKLDPLELRLRNYAASDPEKSLPFSSKSLKECYSVAAAKFDWARPKPEPRSMREGRELVSYGIATAMFPENQLRASARATARPDGTYLVQAGTHDLGTGTYTVMTQLAADALDVSIEEVRFELGDTVMPETPVSGGSWTVGSVGLAGEGCVSRAQGEARRYD